MAAEAAPALELSPREWKYGMIERGDEVRTSVSVRNLASVAQEISLIPTCTCLAVEPASRRVVSGESASFTLVYDSKDDEGKTARAFIVKSDLAGAAPVYFILSGVVRVERSVDARGSSGSAVPSSDSGPGVVELRYYYTPGCRSCEAFISSELPTLEARYGVQARLVRRDLLDSAVYEELAAFAASIGTKVEAIPALRVGDTLLQGDAQIRDRLPGLLYSGAGHDGGGERPPAPAASPVSVELAVLPVVAAGLIDGINPCAFTTIIFLLASLALAGRGRREVLAIGILFTLGVFLTYLGAGFGLFAALRAASGVAIVSTILRWVLVAVLFVFAALSVVDYAKIRAGRTSEMILQLPNALKLRIHASIRTRAKTAALAGSSLALGFLVSIFEFACTGQVYLPTLAYLARAQNRGDAALLLLLYNLCFIAPLVVVFAASYAGVSSRRITELFQRRVGAVKLALAAVFLGLAVLTMLT